MVPIADYERFDNPWSQAGFDTRLVELQDPESQTGVRLDFIEGLRTLLETP